MMRRFACVLVALTLILTSMIPPLRACGPFFSIAIFIQRKHPDLPLQQFAAGNLGILQQTYARSYLAVAYRYLSGARFTSAEQEQLVQLWAHRLGREEDWLKNKLDPQEAWLEARQRAGMSADPDYMKRGSDNSWASLNWRYQEYENCAEDAFLTAAKTLKARSKEFGADSREVRDWLSAQDAVFRNCKGPDPETKNAYLPSDPAESLPLVLKSDRQYQIAAAYFYAAAWDEAERRFSQISQDAHSPWQQIAALVRVRCEIRKATLNEENPKTIQEQLSGIDDRLRKLEADPAMRPFRPAVWRMRGYIQFRTAPEKRLVELAHSIEKGRDPETLRQDLDDYTQLLDRSLGEEPDDYFDPKQPSAATKSFGTAAALRRQSEMTDWIVTFQASNEKASQHAEEKWRATHSLPWLVAVLCKTSPASGDVQELLESSRQFPSSSSAFQTLLFHRARLLAATDRIEEARLLLDGALSALDDKQQPSARNAVLSLRMKLASSLDELLQFASRRPGLITWSDGGYDLSEDSEWWCKDAEGTSREACERLKNPAILFDADAAHLLTEGLPSHLLSEAVESPRLPESLRRQVAQLAWVRAVLLRDDETARHLVKPLASLAPDLSQMLGAYESEASVESRQFAAIFLILHRPELHPYISTGVGRTTKPGEIDSLRDNWWCSPGKTGQSDYYDYYSNFSGYSPALLRLYPDAWPSPPAFLNDSDQKLAKKEWQSLQETGAAVVWLGNKTLEYARQHPDDSRVPEALHLVVRATRFVCDYKDPGNVSKAAFFLLHRKYPKSEWTKKTPYWF